MKIHVFLNGNGRHARLITDLLLKSLEEEPFIWGSDNSKYSHFKDKLKDKYVVALREADLRKIDKLLEFARGYSNPPDTHSDKQ